LLHGKTVAVVVPAYNEATQIPIVLDTMPDFVDRIIVVNDNSTDATEQVVREHIARSLPTPPIPRRPEDVEPTRFNRADLVVLEMRREERALYAEHEVVPGPDTDRIVLVNNLRNARVGGAIANGYLWARDHGIDCTAVMAGDAQMDPGELEEICLPVVDDSVDYVKGNRLAHKAARRMVPRTRHLGNSVLSALTKVASGYWNVSDTQTGYTAISLAALEQLDLYDIYRDYGMPNDMLIKLNIAHCTLVEVPIKPVYAVGEQSKMKIRRVIPRALWLLFSGFVKRVTRKYLVNDFHPIFVFYVLGLVAGLLDLWFLVDIVVRLASDGPDTVTTGTYLGFVVLLLAFMMFFGLAMWLDVTDNDKLHSRRSHPAVARPEARPAQRPDRDPPRA
jgi:glycosyltransferase involved in cell wall biosynthesis